MDWNRVLATLEIEATATEAEAAKSYRDLIRVWHPDNFPSKPDLIDKATAKTKRLNEAWETYQRLNGSSGVLRRGSSPSKGARSPAVTFAAIVVLGVLGALALFGYLSESDVGRPDQRLAKELAEIAYQTNQNLPEDLDDETVFTGTFSGPGLRFTSIYTLKNVSKDQVGPAYFEQIRPALAAHVQARRGRDQAMRTFEAHGVTLAFAFRDKDGVDLITLDVPPSVYAATPEPPSQP